MAIRGGAKVISQKYNRKPKARKTRRKNQIKPAIRGGWITIENTRRSKKGCKRGGSSHYRHQLQTSVYCEVIICISLGESHYFYVFIDGIILVYYIMLLHSLNYVMCVQHSFYDNCKIVCCHVFSKPLKLVELSFPTWTHLGQTNLLENVVENDASEELQQTIVLAYLKKINHLDKLKATLHLRPWGMRCRLIYQIYACIKGNNIIVFWVKAEHFRL